MERRDFFEHSMNHRAAGAKISNYECGTEFMLPAQSFSNANNQNLGYTLGVMH